MQSSTYDPQSTEAHWIAYWEKSSAFTSKIEPKKPVFSLVIPPPNVTGRLHMGHALVNTIQDLLARYHRMQGADVLWTPGVDHAGIATQTVVERHLMQSASLRRIDMSRAEFLKACYAWKEEHQEAIFEQLRRIGCSCDYSKARFTLDEGCQAAVNRAFKTLYDQGLIYRGDYLVNWDPKTQTALADDEVEYEEQNSFLWHLRYDLVEDSSSFLEVATTRPETLFGDQALAVHPKDPRYSTYIGKQVRLPLTKRTIPIIADHHVDPEFGSGVLKITPGHDQHDAQIGYRHNLPTLSVFTPSGLLKEECGAFAGMTILTARGAVEEALKEQGLLLKKEPHTHRVGISYRSGATIEPMLSKQWFVKVSTLKKELLRLIESKEVALLPQGNWERTLFHWVENLRDWCISRQLWWGHQIPIWYHRDDPSRMLCSGTLKAPAEVEENPSLWKRDEDVLDTWFSSALWPFSAKGWPQEEQKEHLARYFPNSILVTGHDILFFWVARMLLMSHCLHKKAPFPKVFLHGLIYAKSYWREVEGAHHFIKGEERKSYDLGEKLPSDVKVKWEKMSKSKGNVINPLEVVEEYGTDSMRIALISSLGDSRQIDLDLRRFEEFRNFSNKLFNATRFVLLQLPSPAAQTQEERDQARLLLETPLELKQLTFDQIWLLNRLDQTIEEVKEKIEQCAFEKAALSAYHFFWDEFCAYGLEMTKARLKSGDPSQTLPAQQLLLVVLGASLRLLHPFAPFITSELFAKLQQLAPALQKEAEKEPRSSALSLGMIEELLNALRSKDCMRAPWPRLPGFSLLEPKQVEAARNKMNLLKKIALTLRQIRAEMQIPPQKSSSLFYEPLAKDYAKEFLPSSSNTSLTPQELFEELEPPLRALVPIEEILFESAKQETALQASARLEPYFVLSTSLPAELQQQEKLRLEKSALKLGEQIERLEKTLSNEQFLSKAPVKLVQEKKQALEELLLEKKQTQEKIALLGG